MDKRSEPYQYNESSHSYQNQAAGKNINGKRNSFNRAQTDRSDDDSRSCFCVYNHGNSVNRIHLKATKRKIARSCVYNIIICTILVSYTFVGAVIFLVIEGESDVYSFITRNSLDSISPSSMSGNLSLLVHPNTVANTWLSRIDEVSRARTVENIWDITVGLNILYRENWTRLVAQEIRRYQEQLVQDVAGEIHAKSHSIVGSGLRPREISRPVERNRNTEWNLAKAFLYSLTVVSTIGYANSAPRTTLGKAVTMGFAAVGVPLMLLYLSSVGSLFSNCAMGVCTRSLCCCLCSNCGYCCYNERRMKEKERRIKQKREQTLFEQQMQTIHHHHQELVHMPPPSSPFTVSTSSNYNSQICPEHDNVKMSTNHLDSDCLSADTSVVDSGDNCLPALTLCSIILVVYVVGGAFVLCRLETSWTYVDGIFFCFMILTTIGFGDAIPPTSFLSTKIKPNGTEKNLIFWFCSVYILVGMALTAMCFNVVHKVIAQTLKHHYKLTGSSNVNTEISLSSKHSTSNIVSSSTSNFLVNDTAVNNAIEYPAES